MALPEEDRPVSRECGAVPCVGIFWLIAEPDRDVFVTDTVPITGAEPYGDCVAHPLDHHEM